MVPPVRGQQTLPRARLLAAVLRRALPGAGVHLREPLRLPGHHLVQPLLLALVVQVHPLHYPGTLSLTPVLTLTFCSEGNQGHRV